MDRLTTDKNVKDMSMLELAYNNCYADSKHNARYRDYELDIDSRQLLKNLVKDMCNDNLSDFTDDEFDQYMVDMLSVEMDSQIGLLALFYRNLWAMADLRERLKEYEDLEDSLNGIPIKQVVESFIKTVEGQTHEDYEHGRILTNSEADKWNEYNQLEEQGLLLRLPCKVGDTVYVKMASYCDIQYAEAEVRDFTHFMSCGFCVVVTSKRFDKQNIPFSEFGKTVFLTKEEAEQKLKEMKNK